jgi:hypothetical protein
MAERAPGVVRVTTPQLAIRPLTTPRSVVRTQRVDAPSLLPLLIPASIAAAALVGKLLRWKKPAQHTAVVEWQVEAVALVLTRSEK